MPRHLLTPIGLSALGSETIMPIESQPFYCLEIETDADHEAIARAIKREAGKIFGKVTYQLFVPADHHGRLNTVNLLYIRSEAPLSKWLNVVAGIPGVKGILTKGDTGRSEDAIQLANEFVQREIQRLVA